MWSYKINKPSKMWLQGISIMFLTSVCTTEGLSFPPHFKFGAATSAYQVEGSWNSSDKSESVWDVHTRTKRVLDGSNGDVACDSYNRYKEDVKMAAELGLDFYRFSISWPRLLPNGLPDLVSEDGSKYYSDLIDELIAHDIEPVITIYHWDLPQKLQDLGGWANPHISDWFADYARVVFSLYADRVTTWITINEPIVVCDVVYDFHKLLPPGILSPGYGNYLCNKNLLLAHAKAWRIYDEEYKPKYNGKVSIVNQAIWFEAKTPEDEDLAELTREYSNGRYYHPIFSKEGGWPESIKDLIAKNSKEQGFHFSRLPPFSKHDIELIRGTYDFLAFNHYTSRVVRKAEAGEQIGSWPVYGSKELGIVLETRPEWEIGGVSWFYLNPVGMRKQLNWFKNSYGDHPIHIMENGYATESADLDDDDRVDYFKKYLQQVLLAMHEDGVNVTAYTAWSLMDNFEWIHGYTVKFGLYKVDFDDPERKRSPRRSAKYYSNVIKTREVEHNIKVEL